jgi:hypothetical protein
MYYKSRVTGKLIIRVYCVGLTALLLLSVGLLLSIFYYMSVLDKRIENDWDQLVDGINSTSNSSETLEGSSDGPSSFDSGQTQAQKEEFAALIKGNFKVMIYGASAICFALFGTLSDCLSK